MIKSDLDPHVDQEPHQMFGQDWWSGGVVRTRIWIRPTCSRPDGERESGGLLDWIKVCVTNKSAVDLLVLDRALLSAFDVFLGNLSRKE